MYHALFLLKISFFFFCVVDMELWILWDGGFWVPESISKRYIHMTPLDYGLLLYALFVHSNLAISNGTHS